jgi:protein-tyrosine phosphatase
MSAVRVLFVCTGNICRSPSAEGVARGMIRDAGLARGIVVDSAGTHGWHVGDPPDPRAVDHAARRGYDLAGLRARRLDTGDFHDFDLLLAMDRGHLRHMERQRPGTAPARLGLFLDLAPGREGTEVPDPYYGDATDFERALDLIEEGAAGLVAAIRRGAL